VSGATIALLLIGSIGTRVVTNTPACKLRKHLGDLPYSACSSGGGAHRTTARPQLGLCVVGALGRFPRAFTANGAREKRYIRPQTGGSNKLRKQRLRHLAVITTD
jgi:hypothetical protein